MGKGGGPRRPTSSFWWCGPVGELPGGHGLLRASQPSHPILSLPVCCCAWLSPESGCCVLLCGVFHLSQVLSPCLGGMQDVLLLKVWVQLAGFFPHRFLSRLLLNTCCYSWSPAVLLLPCLDPGVRAVRTDVWMSLGTSALRQDF